MNRLIITFIILLLISGCSITKNVTPVTTGVEKGSTICIEINPSVVETDILDVIQDGVKRNGYTPVLYRKVTDDCRYSMTYTARQKWDLVKILSYADIHLFESNALVGSVEYRLPTGLFGSGGINPEKFDTTEKKIGPLIDGLFAQVHN